MCNRGRLRRRSMPAIRSMSQRLIRQFCSQFTNGAAGSAPGAVLFVAGGPIGRTHGTALELATDSGAVAHFNRPNKPFLTSVIEHRGRLGRVILRAITEIVCHGWCIDHLPGIEEVMRI